MREARSKGIIIRAVFELRDRFRRFELPFELAEEGNFLSPGCNIFLIDTRHFYTPYRAIHITSPSMYKQLVYLEKSATQQ